VCVRVSRRKSLANFRRRLAPSKPRSPPIPSSAACRPGEGSGTAGGRWFPRSKVGGKPKESPEPITLPKGHPPCTFRHLSSSGTWEPHCARRLGGRGGDDQSECDGAHTTADIFFSFPFAIVSVRRGGIAWRAEDGEGGSRVGGMEPNHRPSWLTVMPIPPCRRLGLSRRGGGRETDVTRHRLLVMLTTCVYFAQHCGSECRQSARSISYLTYLLVGRDTHGVEV